jgi:hypothetical protein
MGRAARTADRVGSLTARAVISGGDRGVPRSLDRNGPIAAPPVR